MVKVILYQLFFQLSDYLQKRKLSHCFAFSYVNKQLQLDLVQIG